MGIIYSWPFFVYRSRCQIDQARLLTLKAAWMMDRAGNKAAQGEIAMIKVVAPNVACRVIDWAMQVHGGMGFIEETGAAQYYRDARILTIYEGTTAIQANDLVGRKTARDGGTYARSIAARIEATEGELAASGSAAALTDRRGPDGGALVSLAAALPFYHFEVGPGGPANARVLFVVAAAVAAVSAAVKACRSKSSRTIGSASTTSRTAARVFRKMSVASPCRSVARNSA